MQSKRADRQSPHIVLDAKQKKSDNRGMKKLPLAKRVQILSMLCEGSSMRSISRVADVSINTVFKLLADAGEACDRFHDVSIGKEPGPRSASNRDPCSPMGASPGGTSS